MSCVFTSFPTSLAPKEMSAESKWRENFPNLNWVKSRVSLTSDRRNSAEVAAISSHFSYPALACGIRHLMQFIITLIGVLSSWLTEANITWRYY